MQLVATTFQGLEEILAGELAALGATDITIKKRAVTFEGDQLLLYAANIHLTTALRVLKPIANFQADTPEELYDQAKSIEWEQYLSLDTTFSIDFAIHSEYFTHTQYAALKVKDAIADRFRERLGKRPSVNVRGAAIPIHLHIDENEVDISLNSSGEPLFKRGYRQGQHKAPLSEVLAAGLIRLSGWDGKTPFYDPMCGSGTLPIEAGLFALKMAPGLIRKDFAFKNWPDFHDKMYRQLLIDAQAGAEWDKRVLITASDQDAASVVQATENCKAAKLEGMLSVFRKSFELAEPPKTPGVAIINPPYGERLKPEDVIAFYKMIGDTLKRHYAGWTVWVLTSNMEAAKFIGLRPSRKIHLFNGPLECRFLRFDMYAGSKKGS
jgi:putative N6-adenine-specific DNA methylase